MKRNICICWDCKEVKDVIPGLRLLWLGEHYGHSVVIAAENEDGLWVFKELSCKEAEV